MTGAGALLKELSALWRTMSAQQGAPLLRACSMTLVVAANEDDDPQQLGETLARLTIEHPSRMIAVRLKQDPEAGLQTRTAVDCWMPFGKREQICAERIEIETGARGLAGVPPLMLGLVVPDLPVVCWVRGRAFRSAASLAAIVSLADRVIVDTTREGDARTALDLLKGMANPKTAVADLAWTRLTRWRSAVASALVSGACKKRVESIDQIEIGWAGAGAPTTAIYLASWLHGVFPGARIRLAMCDPSRPESSRIRRVRLAGKGTEILLERPSGTGVTVSMDGLQMAAVFPALDEVELLSEELSILGRDAVFEDTLGRTGEILKMVEE